MEWSLGWTLIFSLFPTPCQVVNDNDDDDDHDNKNDNNNDDIN